MPAATVAACAFSEAGGFARLAAMLGVTTLVKNFWKSAAVEDELLNGESLALRAVTS